MSTFTARYNARCTSCDHGIREGDEVRWADDVVIHAECREPIDSLAVTREPCMSCFQVPAANGTCGCDE